MKIRLSELKANKLVEIEEQLKFDKESYKHVFTLKEITSAKVKAVAKDFGDIVEVSINILADCILVCSYSLEDVNYTIKTDDIIEFSKTTESDDLILIDGNEIELYEFVLSIIIASVPVRVKKRGAKMLDVEGVKVIKEDEFKKEQKENLDPRLNALDNWEE